MNVVYTSLYMQLLNQTEDDMSQYYTFYNKKWFIVSALFQSLEFWAVRSLPICSKYQFFLQFPVKYISLSNCVQIFNQYVNRYASLVYQRLT